MTLGLYVRSDSPFWWMFLEGAGGRRGMRKSTRVPIGNGGDKRENEQIAEQVYEAAMRRAASARLEHRRWNGLRARRAPGNGV